MNDNKWGIKVFMSKEETKEKIYKGQTDSCIPQIIAILVCSFCMAKLSTFGIGESYKTPVMEHYPISNIKLLPGLFRCWHFLRPLDIMITGCAAVVLVMNVVSIALSFAESDGEESRRLKIVSSFLFLAAHAEYLLMALVFFSGEISNVSYTISSVVILLFFAYILISNLIRGRDKNAKIVKKRMIPVYVTVGLFILFMAYPLVNEFALEHGYTKYLMDRYSMGFYDNSDIYNSLNRGTVIDGEVYCTRLEKDHWYLLKVAPNGDYEILDSSVGFCVTMLTSRGDNLFYWKNVDETFYLCVMNVKTGTVNEHSILDFDLEFNENPYAANYGRFLEVKGDKLYFLRPNSTLWRVDITGDDIDVSSLEKYAYDINHNNLGSLYPDLAVSNAFIREFGNYMDGSTIDGYTVYPTAVSYTMYDLYSVKDDYTYHIEHVITYTISNGTVYYVVEVSPETSSEETTYELYCAGPDLASPRLIGNVDGSGLIHLIVSDAYLVCNDASGITTFDLTA